MKNIGIMAAAVVLALCGCEVAGPADGTYLVDPVEPVVLVAAPAQQVPAEVKSLAGVDLMLVPPSVVTPGDVVTAPTVGLQYDGSIAFRRGTK